MRALLAVQQLHDGEQRFAESTRVGRSRPRFARVGERCTDGIAGAWYVGTRNRPSSAREPIIGGRCRSEVRSGRDACLLTHTRFHRRWRVRVPSTPLLSTEKAHDIVVGLFLVAVRLPLGRFGGFSRLVGLHVDAGAKHLEDAPVRIVLARGRRDQRSR